MAFTRMAFVPEEGFRDSSAYPTTPENETEARDLMQDGLDQIRDGLNVLEQELESTTDGDSGADNIGVTSISGISGNTVQEVLESTKTLLDAKASSASVYTRTELNNGQLDDRYYTETETDATFATKAEVSGIVLGQVLDNSLTTAKMATEQKRGVANGVASLDSNGQVPINELALVNNMKRKIRMKGMV